MYQTADAFVSGEDKPLLRVLGGTNHVSGVMQDAIGIDVPTFKPVNLPTQRAIDLDFLDQDV